MYDGVIQELIDQLGRLPGVGPKSAQRIAFHLIETDSEVALELADVLREAKEKVRFLRYLWKRFGNRAVLYLLRPKARTNFHLRCGGFQGHQLH